jgi:hypothetical protein
VVSAIREAKAGGSLGVQGQPEHNSETLYLKKFVKQKVTCKLGEGSAVILFHLFLCLKFFIIKKVFLL